MKLNELDSFVIMFESLDIFMNWQMLETLKHILLLCYVLYFCHRFNECSEHSGKTQPCSPWITYVQVKISKKTQN